MALPDPTATLAPLSTEGPITEAFTLTATLDDPSGLCDVSGGQFVWSGAYDDLSVVGSTTTDETVEVRIWQPGSQTIAVVFDGCANLPSAEATLIANGCAFDQANYAVEEGTTLQVGIERSFGDAGFLSCELFAVDGSAIAGVDFSDPSGPFGWPSGVAVSRSAEVQAFDDGIAEGTESFDLFLKIAAPGGGIRGGFIEVGKATVDLVDAPEPTEVTVADTVLTVAEDGGPTSIRFLRSGPLSSEFFFSVEVTGITATEGDDYINPFQSGSIAFPAGALQFSRTLPILDDDLVEGLEELQIRITGATSGVTVGTPDTTRVQILDDDEENTPTVGFSARQFSGAESSTSGLLILRSTAVETDFEVELIVEGGTANPGEDYQSPPQLVQFVAGELAQQVALPLLLDYLAEDDETISLRLRNPTNGVALAVGSDGTLLDTATFTILDSGTCSFSPTNYQALETSPNVSVRTVRDGGSAGALPCVVKTGSAGGPAAATPGLDFVAFESTLLFADSEDDPLVSPVELIDDDLVEPIEEIVLELYAPASAGALPNSPPRLLDTATIRLASDDVEPRRNEVRFLSTTFAAREGAVSRPILVERLDPSTTTASANLCLSYPGQLSPDDVEVELASVAWGAGEAGTRAFLVRAQDDDLVERPELGVLELCEIEGAVAGQPRRARLVVQSDDVRVDPETTISDLQGPQRPHVISDSRGRRVIVWQQPDNEGFGVFGLMLGEDGDLVRPPFRLSSPDGSQTRPRAAFRADGGFYAVWQENASATGGAQLETDSGGLSWVSSADGATTITGRGFGDDEEDDEEGETDLSGEGGGSEPDVSAGDDGSVVVTWFDDGEGISGVNVGEDGEPEVPPIDVAQLVGAANAVVAVASSGDFVVAWEEVEAANGEDRIFARRFDQAAQPTSGVLSVTAGPGAQRPRLAIDDAGDFIVAWHQEGAEGLDVFAQRFSGETRIGAAQQINSNSLGDQSTVSLDLNATGDAAYVWESHDALTAGSREIVGRLFDAAGTPLGSDIVIASDADGTRPALPEVTIEDVDRVTVVYERRNPAGESLGLFTRELRPSLVAAQCSPGDGDLCLNEQRFTVTVDFEDFDANNGTGQPSLLTNDSGTFWFFSPDNIEVVVKVLDACESFGRYWVFAAGLTNTEVSLRVDDTWSGATKTYFNTRSQPFQTITDTAAFDTCDLSNPLESPAANATRLVADAAQLAAGLTDFEQRVAQMLRQAQEPEAATQAAGTCVPDDSTLCLGGERFAATASWDAGGAAGEGHAVPLTTDTGTFWFFAPNNVEMVVKVLDACDSFGSYWVFAAGLTDLATQLNVEDTVSGAQRTYQSLAGIPFQPVLDLQALPCQ
jgi:hypothetical protein